MKRGRLIDRLKFLEEKGIALDEAIREHGEASTVHGKHQGRLRVRITAVEYGLAVARYLGGRQ